MKKEQSVQPLDLGRPVFEWEAFDHHPYKRGWLWYTLFAVVLVGGSGWAIWDDPQWGWLVAVTFLVAAAVYLWMHRNGNEKHQVQVFERGLFIGEKKFIPREKIAGYWFVYGEGVAVLNLEIYTRKETRKISLQMGDNNPDFFRSNFSDMGIEEMADMHEAVLDMWIRGLKL